MARCYDPAVMFQLLLVLSETAADVEDDLMPIAIALVVAAMVYAAVAAWRVTPKGHPSHH